MGFSHKSHGKRSDKETQSPMLKIFKDMMQKDKRDPEKTNLLIDRHPEKKRKHYSGSRSKSGHKTVSSSSDHPKKETQFRRSEVEARNAHFDASRSQKSGLPFQGETRESWWFWGSHQSNPKEEDTCSWASCALKKLLRKDSACIFCTSAIFLISIIATILVVYRSMPCAVTNSELTLGRNTKMFFQKPENERLKRKIGGLGKWSTGPSYEKEWRDIFEKRSSHLDGFNLQGNDLASLVESENKLSKIIDSDKMSDIQHSERLKDFYKKLVQTDAAIRNLRKSLNDNSFSTNNFDINSNSNFDFYNNIDFDSDDIDINDISLADRTKRSVKNKNPNRIFHFKRREPKTQAKIDNGKLITKTTINMTANKKDNKNPRNKRFGNFTDGTFVIEKNKVVIQFNPNRKVAKCSHSPKDSAKTHEAQLTHPFYKNTQRLDELLDQIMDKKIPDFFSDQTEMGVFFNKNKKCKHPPHPSNEEIILVKDDDILKDYDQGPKEKEQSIDQRYENTNRKDFPTPDFRVVTEKIMKNNEKIATTPDYGTSIVTTKVAKNAKDPRNSYENDFFDDSDGVEKKVERSTTPSYDILLSISTPGSLPAKASIRPTTDFPERPNMRKLQQLNMKEEDGVAYEDLKEVLADYKEGHDDDDKETDRKKRTLQNDIQVKIASMKNYPVGVPNPNWKGAMPLYPEELTQMMKSDISNNQNSKNEDKNSGDNVESPMGGSNTEDFKEVPIHNRDVAAEGDDVKPRQSDVEYVEDYLDNGYEKLVELAQAYSDYGVLDEKKSLDSEKKTDNKGHPKANKKRLGLSKRIRNSFKRGMKKHTATNKLQRLRMNQGSEGIRIEIQPDKNNYDDHVKPADAESYKSFKDMLQKHVKVVTDDETIKSLVTSHPEITTQRLDFKLPGINKYKTSKTLDTLPDVLYKKRTLKTLYKGSGYEATDKMSNKDYDVDKFEKKRETNRTLESELDDIDKNIKHLKNASMTFNFDDTFKTSKDTNNRFHFKRDTEKITENNENINVIAEKSLLVSQSTDKLKFKRDANNTMDTMESNETQSNISFDLNQNKRGIFRSTTSKPNVTNVKKVNINVDGKSGSSHPNDDKNAKEGSASLSKFFTVLSNWFSSLDEMEMAQNRPNRTTRGDQAPTSNISNHSSVTESQLTIPIYDSDIIENIGHRSRVLLSIDTNNSTEKTNGDFDVRVIEYQNTENISHRSRELLSIDTSDCTGNTNKGFVLNNEDQNSDNISYTPILLSIDTSNSTEKTNTDSNKKEEGNQISENISRRSRVLLSIDTSNTTEKADDVSNSDDEENQIPTLPYSTESITTNNRNSVEDKDVTGNTKSTDADQNQTENHNNIVKRQAIDDSNLIFWNDLYDEDYGVNTDPLENNIRDKHSADRNDFLKKSNTWIQDKVKRIANKFYDLGDFKKAANEKVAGSKHVKRSVKQEDDEEDNTVKLDLATLTEKMKEVCKETVRAVQETKHIQVREENKEGQAASSLMQQLVRLMTDLVDFQVQERTCRKLPDDLRRFLDWLTANKEEDTDNTDNIDDLYTEKSQEVNYDMSFDNKPTEQDLLKPNDKENTDYKTDCLGSLHAVQNLIREYEEMSEDDKSVMTGVKTYLENQRDYLQKQLSTIEDKTNKSRYRRDIVSVGHTVAQTIDVTAKHLDREYKNFRKVYQIYKGKAGNVYKQVLNTSAQLKDAVTGSLKKVSKTTRATPKHIKVTNIHTKFDGKKKDILTKHTVANAKGKHRFFHRNIKKRLKSNANAQERIGFENNDKEFEEHLKDTYDIVENGGHGFNSRNNNNFKDDESYVDKSLGTGDKDGRNIKDVYFKAVEEAKKTTLSKGSHIYDGNVFDKTDVFRVV